MQSLDAALDRIEPDAAPRNLGHGAGGGEAGREHVRGQLVVVAHLGQPHAARPGADRVQVEPAPVVLNRQLDHPAAQAGSHEHLTARRLVAGDALARRLDAVVDRVAHDVQQRVAQPLHKLAIHLDVVAGDHELHLFAEAARQIAHAALESLRGLAQRHHAQAAHGVVHAARGAVGVRDTAA